MWTNRLIFFGPAVAALLALSPTGVSAQGVSLTGGTLVCPDDQDDGSCNLVFRNRMELVGLSPAQLNETVFRSCPGFPNGAYKRANTNIDYVILPISNLNQANHALTANQIESQIVGLDVTLAEAGGTQVMISPTPVTGNSPTVTVEITDSTVRSQIIDLPGFDFILFEKSQGGGAQVATLVCDLKMWFRTAGGSIRYGLQNFNVQHGVNAMKIGFVAGPSGMKSQARAKEACERAGNDAPTTAVDTDLEKKVSYLAGIYKVTAEDQANPSNVTGCGLDDYDPPMPVIANYCDASELPGRPGGNPPDTIIERPNSCNPNGEGGGVPEPNVAGVNGNASTCYFTSRGTTYSFAC